MPTLYLDNIEFQYEEHGSGVPVVLCHEFAQNHSGWNAQVSELAKTYRVVTFSRRGYPPSDVPATAGDYAFSRQVADLEGICTKLSLEPAHMIGHGAGGNIALSYGLKQPAALRSLVLVGAGAGSTAPDNWKADNAIFADEIQNGGLDALVTAISNAPNDRRFVGRILQDGRNSRPRCGSFHPKAQRGRCGVPLKDPASSSWRSSCPPLMYQSCYSSVTKTNRLSSQAGSCSTQRSEPRWLSCLPVATPRIWRSQRCSTSSSVTS